jgi:hypothetical protein
MKKHLTGREGRDAESLILIKISHCEKQHIPKDFIELGILISVKEEHSLKHSSSSEVIESGRTICDSLLQWEKQCFPI